MPMAGAGRGRGVEGEDQRRLGHAQHALAPVVGESVLGAAAKDEDDGGLGVGKGREGGQVRSGNGGGPKRRDGKGRTS